MLIGITGRPDAGQSAAADYLARAHGFAIASPSTIHLCDAPRIVIPNVQSPEAADLVHDNGGMLLHLINPAASGSDPELVLQDGDRELTVGQRPFSLFNELDELMAEVQP